MKRLIVLLVMFLMLSGCAVFRGEPGPKLYDSATISIISDNILLPQATDKDFVNIAAMRLNEFTKSEITRQGSLEVIPECRQRTLKITQEITGIVMRSVSEISTGFFLAQIFRGSATSIKNDDIAISTRASVYDCESGKVLGVYDYTMDGPNPIESLKSLANVNYAYRFQNGPGL